MLLRITHARSMLHELKRLLQSRRDLLARIAVVLEESSDLVQVGSGGQDPCFLPSLIHRLC